MATIISTFDDRKVAERAIDALRKEGFENPEIQVLEGEVDELISELAELGFDEEEARSFAEAAEEGKILVAARVTDEEGDQAEAIMERFESSEDEEGDDEDRERVEVVEEELSVGKQRAGSGGVRVTSTVNEQPVEETVTLRQEEVEAERRGADRELSPEEAERAFEEKTIEMTGSKEEAKVRKQSRVVGEVEVRKETSEREETVRDTVRKTDVEVEELGKRSSGRR